MGYEQKGSIRSFWPDDTDNEMYLACSTDLDVIIDCVQTKWPGLSLADVQISAEHIHTDCLTYDQYDGGDYTNFVVVAKK